MYEQGDTTYCRRSGSAKRAMKDAGYVDVRSHDVAIDSHTRRRVDHTLGSWTKPRIGNEHRDEVVQYGSQRRFAVSDLKMPLLLVRESIS